MTAPTIPDFDSDERALVAKLLYARYGSHVGTEDAEAELALELPSPLLTPCPTLYWQARGAHFVVTKLGRREFFYDDDSQYGTGIEQFDDLHLCVQSLLRVQSDHERGRGGPPQ